MYLVDKSYIQYKRKQNLYKRIFNNDKELLGLAKSIALVAKINDTKYIEENAFVIMFYLTFSCKITLSL